MSAFLGAVAALLAVVLAYMLRPLLRAARPGVSRDALNVALYRDQLAELEADLRAGTLAPDQYEKSREDMERRTMDIAARLRCLVCQNQTIADSSAGLAVDLRNQIREQLAAGAGEAQILDYMVQRYGDFVLYRPPFRAATALLWLGPFVLLAGGLALLYRLLARRRSQAAPELTPAERERARALLGPR